MKAVRRESDGMHEKSKNAVKPSGLDSSSADKSLTPDFRSTQRLHYFGISLRPVRSCELHKQNEG